MVKKQFTAEELTSRWEDMRAIENLMGRWSFLNMQKKESAVWEALWCRKAPEPSLMFNDGGYRGYEAIAGYYRAVDALTALRTELVQKAYPQKLAGKAPEEIFGAGSLEGDHLTTPVIELAGDGRTAKGLWSTMGGDVNVTAAGEKAYHRWGRVAADFVKEDGAWKLWHLIFAVDLYCPTGGTWAVACPQYETKPEFAALAEFKFPEPNVRETVHEIYYPKRPLNPFPAVPVAFETFAETFSYGY